MHKSGQIDGIQVMEGEYIVTIQLNLTNIDNYISSDPERCELGSAYFDFSIIEIFDGGGEPVTVDKSIKEQIELEIFHDIDINFNKFWEQL